MSHLSLRIDYKQSAVLVALYRPKWAWGTCCLTTSGIPIMPCGHVRARAKAKLGMVRGVSDSIYDLILPGRGKSYWTVYIRVY